MLMFLGFLAVCGVGTCVWLLVVDALGNVDRKGPDDGYGF